MGARFEVRKKRGPVLLVMLGVGLHLPLVAQPYVFTHAAQPVSATNATLNGMVTPRGLPTTAWFEWGTNRDFGQRTESLDAGNGTGVISVSTTLPQLAPDSVFCCRLVASNSAGIRYGWERWFTTGRRVATWGNAFLSPSGSVLPPAGLSNVVAVAGGDYHGLALTAHGAVVIWGRHPIFNLPVVVPEGVSNVMAIAGGRDHSLALRTDGRVIGWGANSGGQTNVPAGLSNVVAIAAGDEHCVALRSNGTLAVWGLSSYPTVSYSPPGMSNIYVAISAGDRHSLALRHDGRVVGWGDVGQSTVPAGLSNVVAIAAGYLHSLALKADGTVVAWGSGSGTEVPVGLSNVVQVAAGDVHSQAVKADGSVIAWGKVNLGPEATTPPLGLNEVVQLACGDEYSMALAANVAPQVTPRTLTGPVNRDTVLSLFLSAKDPNGESIVRRVQSLPGRGDLFQYEAGGRGAAITEPSTIITDASARVFFAPWPDEFGAPYATFSFTASDGTLESIPCLMTINIVPEPTVNVAGPSPASPKLSIEFSGLSNASYSVWASTNLMAWSRIGSASQTFSGSFVYSDTTDTNLPQRFYRVRSP